MTDLDLRLLARGMAALFPLALAAGLPAQQPLATAAQSFEQQAPGFVENRGQWDQDVRFLFAADGVATWVAGDGLCLQREVDGLGVAVRLHFVDAEGTPSGAEALPTLRNWLRADSAGGPVTGVRSFRRIVRAGLQPATDLVLRAAAGHLEYDLVLGDGADLHRLVVAVEGHDRMRLAADGALVLDTALGELRQSPPHTWRTDAGGRRQELPSRFVLRGADRFGFEVDGWQGGELTIDPGLLWGTFFGGSGLDRCTAVEADSTGAAVVAGTSNSTNLPATVGAYRTTPQGGTDAFVARLSPDGHTVQVCTYLGGTADEITTDLQVLSGDRVAVAGTTSSTNYPLTGNRYQQFSAGGIDAFVAVLPQDLSALSFSSYFGGTGNDTDIRLYVAANEDIWLAGRCTGSMFVTANAIQNVHNSPGSGDMFLAIMDRSQLTSTSLRFGTYFGGSADERSVDSLNVRTVGGSEIATIGLTTDSTNLLTTVGTYQAAPVGTLPTGYIVELDPSQLSGAQTLVYATYFGASGGTTKNVCVARDSAGLFGFAATTSSPSWTTTSIAYQRIYGGGASDVIAGRFDPSRGTSALVLASYYGGSGDEVLEGLQHDYISGTIDLATFVGSTTSTNLPVSASAMQSAVAGTGGAGFVAQLDYRSFLGSMLKYGSYYDGCGPGAEMVHALYRAPNGEITIAGETTAALVPGTPAGFQHSPGGGVDGFVARLDTIAQPPSFTAFGTGCGMPGEVPVLSAGTPPRIAQPFQVNLTNLLNNGGQGGAGFMVLGFSNTLWLGSVPLPVDLAFNNMPGCPLNVDPYDFYLSIYAGNSGTWGLPVPASMDFYAMPFYLQFFMIDARVNAFGLAASNGGALNVRF